MGNTSSEIIVFGHHQKLKFIPMSKPMRKKLFSDGLIVSDSAPEIWQSEQPGEVVEGILQNLIIGIGEKELPIQIPEKAPVTQAIRNRDYLVWYETAKIWFRGNLGSEFNPKKLCLNIQKYDLDPASEPYIFTNVSYPDVAFEEIERDSVDSGFFIIDHEDGIIKTEFEEDDDTFTLSASLY